MGAATLSMLFSHPEDSIWAAVNPPWPSPRKNIYLIQFHHFLRNASCRNFWNQINEWWWLWGPIVGKATGAEVDSEDIAEEGGVTKYTSLLAAVVPSNHS